uniref:Uncharacterized protein n=1 Tax=Anguilla anguilla TaxID=7936 RepID=A0A0E9VWF8_ANGAN
MAFGIKKYSFLPCVLPFLSLLIIKIASMAVALLPGWYLMHTWCAFALVSLI